MLFRKKTNSVNTLEDIDELEVNELEKLLYYLISYKGLVKAIRLYNVKLYNDISSESHLDFDGNPDGFYMETFKEEVLDLRTDFNRLVRYPYNMRSSDLKYLNQDNKFHFIHLTLVTLNEVKNGVSNLNHFLNSYLLMLEEITITKNFSNIGNFNMGDVIGKHEFLGYIIEDIESYFRLMK